MIKGMIGDFSFEMNKVDYQKVSEQFNYGWSKQERLYANPIFMKKNKSSHPISISGTLVLQKIYALDALHEIADKKEPVTFVTVDNARVFRVIIKSLKIDRDILLQNGAEIRKKFTLTMEEFYGNS